MKTELFSYAPANKKAINFCLATFRNHNNELQGTLGIDFGQAYVHISMNGVGDAESLSSLLIKIAETISSTRKSDPSLLEKVS